MRRYEPELLDNYLSEFQPRKRPYVFVEFGAGTTTPVIASHAARLGGRFYSCDLNHTKCAEVAQDISHPVSFLYEDTTEAAMRIAAVEDHVDLLFLDAAPSAMKTFVDFQVLEEHLCPGSVVIIDNAELPGRTVGPRHSKCRKGKIVVPYLLGSAYWEVFEHPEFGGSMVAGVRHAEPKFTLFEYEG